MVSDSGFIDVLGREDTIKALPYPQEYDYLWTDERNSFQDGNGIWDPSLWFEGTADRQGVAETNPLTSALVVGIAYSGLLLANALLNPPPKPKLENDDMCGITTGGQDECWWDCAIISDPSLEIYTLWTAQAIANPECLRDCFSKTTGRWRRQKSSDSTCFAKLIEDVTSKGTCDTGNNPAAKFNETINLWGWHELDNDCTLAGTEITKGTCSTSTERDLQTKGCAKLLAQQPNIIKNTLVNLVLHSCTDHVTVSLLTSLFGRKGAKKILKTRGKVAPISHIDLTTNTKTELNFENTRHRYPWICSLRTRLKSEHLCAVNLLAVPPNPTVIVGSAHCTYLCKDTNNEGKTLPSCCCVSNDKGQESCATDTVKCGQDPRAVEMGGSDAEIICGEWQTGSTQYASGEEYNVVLPILEII